MTFPWGVLLALAILGLVSLSRHHSHANQSQLAAAAAAAGVQTSSWDDVAKLDHYDSNTLKQFITPLVSISTNAYASVSDVPGWHPAPKLPTLSPGTSSSAGAHAVLYQEDSSKRLVLAFRGTYTQADSCVDRILFGDASPVLVLPALSWCMSTYSNASLDYLSQSLEYTRKVVKEYSGAPLLLTGHSLGGALAVLVSVSLAGESPGAQVVLPVVGFSSPGPRAELRKRGVKIEQREMESRIAVIGDEWDLVVKTFWKEQLGTVCLVQHQQPKDCAACSSGNDTSLCSNCAFQTHGLNQIMSLLDGGATTECVKL